MTILWLGLTMWAQRPGWVIMPAEVGIRYQKGNPFTATVQTTLTQVLPDGTKKTRIVEDRIARDGKGRIYQEQHLPWTEDVNHPIYYVNIYDPVAKQRIHIDPQKRIVAMGPLEQQYQTDYNPKEYLALRARRPGESFKNENLGTQEIGGVKAWGRRTTHALPETSGNTQTIVSIDECWYSDQAGVDVLLRRSDPRSGEQVSELVNLAQAEPDPTLFQTPPGYAIQPLPDRRR
jgi:hypothetical protein